MSPCGGEFHQNVSKIRKYDRKLWHTLNESNVWGSNSNIKSINDLNMWYFIYLMIKEDFPSLERTHLLQLNGQALNKTAIYHRKILTQHKMAPNTFFYKWLNIPLKINFPWMEMMKTWCSEVNLNLESLFRCTYVNEIFVSYFIDNFGQKCI